MLGSLVASRVIARLGVGRTMAFTDAARHRPARGHPAGGVRASCRAALPAVHRHRCGRHRRQHRPGDTAAVTVAGAPAGPDELGVPQLLLGCMATRQPARRPARGEHRRRHHAVVDVAARRAGQLHDRLHAALARARFPSGAPVGLEPPLADMPARERAARRLRRCAARRRSSSACAAESPQCCRAATSSTSPAFSPASMRCSSRIQRHRQRRGDGAARCAARARRATPECASPPPARRRRAGRAASARGP